MNACPLTSCMPSMFGGFRKRKDRTSAASEATPTCSSGMNILIRTAARNRLSACSAGWKSAPRPLKKARNMANGNSSCSSHPFPRPGRARRSRPLCSVLSVPCRIGGALRLMLSLMVCTATPTRSNISALRESPACRKPAAFPYPARDSPRAPFSGTRQKLYARTVVRNPLHRRRNKLNTLLKPDARGTTRAALRLRASPSTLRSIFPFPRERQ